MLSIGRIRRGLPLFNGNEKITKLAQIASNSGSIIEWLEQPYICPLPFFLGGGALNWRLKISSLYTCKKFLGGRGTFYAHNWCFYFPVLHKISSLRLFFHSSIETLYIDNIFYCIIPICTYKAILYQFNPIRVIDQESDSLETTTKSKVPKCVSVNPIINKNESSYEKCIIINLNLI